jgi:hypothetical protein
VLRQQVPNLADHAIAIVGERLDQDRDPAGAVALVAHLLEGLALGGADPLLDGPLDVVLRHIGAARLVDDQPQARVRRRVSPARTRSGGDLTNQLGE